MKTDKTQGQVTVVLNVTEADVFKKALSEYRYYGRNPAERDLAEKMLKELAK